MLHLHVPIFSVSQLAFKILREERQDPSNYREKTQVPFVPAVVLLYVFNWTIYFISLRPPILRAFQPPPQPRSQAPLLLVPKRTLGKRLP